MAGHAQLKFVMTECSKTQIRLTRGPIHVFSLRELPCCIFQKLQQKDIKWNTLLYFQFFIVLGVIVVIELIIAISIIIMYTVPEVRERFLRSTPEHILRSAIERYMDDSDIKTWIDLIQQEVCQLLCFSFAKRSYNHTVIDFSITV